MKILLCGDAGVGKTVFMKYIRTGVFDEKYAPTIAVDIRPIAWEEEGKLVSYNIWDCAGDKRYIVPRPDILYIGADKLIVMFNLNDRDSFLSVNSYIQDVFKITGIIPVIIIGAKREKEEGKPIYKDEILRFDHPYLCFAKDYFDMEAFKKALQ